jgi:hypothetical protein
VKLRRPVDRVTPPPTCSECGGPVNTILRTEVNAAAGLVRVDAVCAAGHPHHELRPLVRRAAPPTPDP